MHLAMKVDADIQIVQQRLQLMDYTPEPIARPGPTGKSADLWAHADSDSIVVEVKSRVDDAKTADQLTHAPVGEILEREGDLGRKNRLSAVVEEASLQIADSQHQYPGVGILWFRANPRLGFDDSEHQMQATLLGIRDVVWIRGDDSKGTSAFGATFSDFYRFPNIDAAVLEIEDKGRLLLNPFSRRKPELMHTRLYEFFAKTGGVLDIDEIPAPKAFIVRGEVDRGDENAVRKALCEQYPGYKFILFDMKSYGFITKVDLSRTSS